MTSRLAALCAGSLLLGALGCAQGVTTSNQTTSAAAGTAGTGGATTGGTGGTGATGGSGGTGGGTGGVPGSCSAASDCAALDGPCSTGDCVASKCVAKPANDSKSCDDGNACTQGDTCAQGKCVGITKSCGQAAVCHIAACNPATGACEEKPGDDGAQCDDGDPCTAFGTCQNGTCSKGQTMDCSFLDTDCGLGMCDPKAGCKTVPAFDDFACDDGLFCTLNTVCKNGKCGGGIPTPCAPAGGCFVGMCDELNQTCTSLPGNDGAACDDGSPCTSSTTCSGGVCSGGMPANEGLSCDDGVTCTSGTICTAGVCGGGIGPVIYFSEDFASNAAGWNLGPEWQIGSAKQGISMGFANPDPGMDHSPSADNGVAGTIIGGDVSTNQHGYEFIESPPFDTSLAQGKVILGYYRWLNSDSDPSMHSRVEVWNGSQWITVWVTGQFMVDGSWVYAEHDITNYKNAAMKVRFGFDVKEMSFASFSGWNLDDVLVASQSCP